MLISVGAGTPIATLDGLATPSGDSVQIAVGTATALAIAEGTCAPSGVQSLAQVGTVIAFGTMDGTATPVSDAMLSAVGVALGSGGASVSPVGCAMLSAVGQCSAVELYVIINSVSPLYGTNAGGIPVTIYGSGFVYPVSVLFNGVPATNVVVVSSTEIQAVIPSGNTGPASVIVNDVNGSGVLVNGFFYGSSFRANVGLMPPILTFSGDDGVLTFPEIGGNTGLIIAYCTDCTINSLSLDDSDADVLTTPCIQQGDVSIYALQNALGATTVTPNFTGGTYCSAVIFQIANDTTTPWNIFSAGQVARADQNYVVTGPQLFGAEYGISNVYVTVLAVNDAGMDTTLNGFSTALSDDVGVFAYQVGKFGMQCANFGGTNPQPPIGIANGCAGLVVSAAA
jgi:hypothetical protein